MPELTIIIPCYNCAKTLEEAANSCFIQGLKDFEIVMVDDGSTDNTRDLIKTLAEKHKEISYIFHEKNMGGGAARNTATAHAKSNLIFCLDSDDILTEGMLRKMADFQKERQCDGVGISTSIKFKGTDIEDIAFTNQFGYVGEKIPLDSLLQKDGVLSPLYSTFLYTKKAFEIAGGYPTAHGFDTQGFAWRFLAKGLIAYTCPNTTYLHRINFHKSYYTREYENGNINHNWLRIYEEFLYLFDDETKKGILGFDFNHPTQTLNSFVEKRVSHLTPHKKEKDMFDYYWLGTQALLSKDGEKAIECFLQAKALKMDFPVLFARIKESFEIAGKAPEESLQKEIAAKTESFYRHTLQGGKASLFERIKQKIMRIINI